jgi:hypothetical protein
LSLTSCGSNPMTQEEKLKKIQECKDLWLWYYLNWHRGIVCKSYVEDKVNNCIEEYTRWIDEKYNNPDTVSNLIEESYVEVVKTCNDVFWEKK